MFSLKEKIVIVTGAAGLLGEKHAEAVLAFGGIPLLIDINRSQLTKVVKKLKENFKGRIDSFVVDITNESEVKENSILINLIKSEILNFPLCAIVLFEISLKESPPFSSSIQHASQFLFLTPWSRSFRRSFISCD